MKLELSRQIFEKYANMKFHENPSSECRVVSSGRREGQTDMTTLTVAFRLSANWPKNSIGLFFVKTDETDVIFWSADDRWELQKFRTKELRDKGAKFAVTVV